MRQGLLAERGRVALHQIDDAGRQPRTLEKLQNSHSRERGERRRLPQHGVAHQGRRAGEIARDRREVEGRDGEHEAVERAQIERVRSALGASERLFCDALGEVRVETQKVDQLAGRVELGLVRGLALAEERSGVQRLARLARE